jgi:Cof subfamily protein (haloacid dehalogenase superfamily)
LPLTDLLAVDLDFTLLDTARNITADGRAALLRARDAGIRVALASGRIASSMVRYADELGLEPCLISCNGAFVLDEGGRVLASHTLQQSAKESVVAFCRRLGLHANFYANDCIYYAEETQWAELYAHRAQPAASSAIGWDSLAELPAHKVIVIAEPARIREVSPEALRLAEGSCACVTWSEPEYLEFLCPDCSKATGLEVVAGHLGVERNRTAAIGDYHNDIPMLKWAGHSAAVANAPDDVKRAAKCVVPGHEEGGVASYVDLLLQNLEQS